MHDFGHVLQRQAHAWIQGLLPVLYDFIFYGVFKQVHVYLPFSNWS